MKALIAKLLLVFLLVASCRAESPDEALTKRLDEIVTSTTSFMGTVLVVDGDRVLLDKGYGKADVEWNIQNAPDVKFRLGSLTKQFTAALVLLLQEEGKLRIEDTVKQHLDGTPKAWRKITLTQLLGHTSGIPDFTDDKAFYTWCMNSRTKEDELAFFKNKALEFEPGSKFQYSNSNYEVLGAVIEKVTGRVYADLLRERIFEPLGMKNTGLDTDELILPKRAQGYFIGKNGLSHARSESMSVPWAAGSMYSNTGDLLRWEHGLFDRKVLHEKSLKLMTTAGKGDYGLGVQVKIRDNVKFVEHGGGIEGFDTYLAYAPEQRFTIVVLSNIAGDASDKIGAHLREACQGVLAVKRRTVGPA